MKLITLFLLLIPITAFGIIQNKFIIPIGGIEGITANTGVARQGSIGSVIYNPAGLAYIRHKKVSVNGSAFTQNTVNLNILEKKSSFGYFQATPSQITTAFKITEDINLAASLLVPKASKFQTSINIDSINSEVVYEDQDSYFGLTGSYYISPSLSIGASGFLVKKDFKKNEAILSEVNNIKSQEFTSLGMTGFSLSGSFGALYSISPSFQMGLNLNSPTVNLSSSFDSRYLLLKSDGTETSLTKSGDASITAPGEVAFGISFNEGKLFKVLFDIGYQFSKLSILVNSDASEGVAYYNYISAIRAHLAFEYYKSTRENITLGFMYNAKNEVSSLDFIGASLGYRNKEAIADTMIGFFVNKGLAAKEANVETDILMAGLFLSTTINFIK